VNPPLSLRVMASVRIPSSHGPDTDYEIVQASVSSGPGAAREAVFIRLVVADVPQGDRVAHILIQDLPAVQLQWTRFVQDVLWRRAQAGDPAAKAALERMSSGSPAPAAPAIPVISASGGRFGHGSPSDVPEIQVKKEKKRTPLTGEPPRPPPPPAPPPAPRVERERDPFEVAFEEVGDGSASPARGGKPGGPRHELIGFNISSPPTVDRLLRVIEARPQDGLVVAAMSLVPKVEEFLRRLQAGTAKGRPTEFVPIVLRRGGSGAPAQKKLKAELTVGLTRILSSLDSVLWIVPG
jgi:hypothetical protein